MPLPTPFLDDRHFQDIVDQAKRLIPHYCQEWTDHNVSDPGVTLIELFAWMTDMLLYRVNQVPDKNYVKFLEMIGVQLEESHAATAPVTFYLSTAQPVDVTIPADTEVATVRTEADIATIFTTETALTIRPPDLVGLFTRNASRDAKDPWPRHDLRQSELLNKGFDIFPQRPGPGDALFMAFKKDLSNHILALALNCEVAGGAGIDPTRPPLRWQVWQGKAARWVTCELEHDGTGGFNRSGEIILHLPPMALGEFQGVKAFWLRCVVTEAQGGSGSYKVSPTIRQFRAESRGGTVRARHAVSVREEILGVSDGAPGQTFTLLHTPILTLDPARDYLVVQPHTGPAQRWHEVTDFADSGPGDQHFVLDKLDGTLTLGPSLLQPDGTMYSFGATPEKESTLSFSHYQHGGGVAGNVAQQTLTVLKSSIAYVAHVANRAPAVGGRDAQSLADAKLRAPQMLRTRTRAVTTDDYEHLTSQVEGVARACCLAPGAQPGASEDPRPGQIVIVVLPQSDNPQERILPEQLVTSAEMRSAVLAHLDARRLLGVSLEVRQPQYTWISVRASLRLAERSDPALVSEVQQQAEEALYRYLNPYIGGPHGDGWPFGRPLNRSELYSLLHRIENIEFVEDVQISINESPGRAAAQPVAAQTRSVSIPRYGLICSDRHQVKVS
jgi:predicted phage baseplate assembly protein